MPCCAYFYPDRSLALGARDDVGAADLMVLTSGSDLGLLPLGLIMFGFLAIPPMVVATVVSQMRRALIGS